MMPREVKSNLAWISLHNIPHGVLRQDQESPVNNLAIREGCGAAPAPSPDNAPTWSQASVLAAILAVRAEQARGPTMRELADMLHMASTNAISDFVVALEKKGYLSREPGKAVTLTVLVMPDCPCCKGSGRGKARRHATVTRDALKESSRSTLCKACHGTGYQLRPGGNPALEAAKFLRNNGLRD